MTEISELDPADEDGLREFYDVEQAAQLADRPYAVLRTFPQLRQMAQQPSSYFRRVLLAARESGQIVGTADVGVPLQDNRHLAQLDVRVVPAARRRGVGTALHEEALRHARAAGRTTFAGEVHQPGPDQSSVGVAFATALGYEIVHREDHQVLDLPLPAERLAALPDTCSGYEIVTWGERAPDDLVEAYAAMLTQMGQDVPTGEVDYQPVTIDVARVREGEQRVAQAYANVVAAARRTADGVFGGYTLVHLAHDADYVVQDDTLVMPAHRGHGLGMTLKAAVLRILEAEHPERRLIHTWNAVDNPPMQRINRELGFRPVELELVMQRQDADG
jgi:GNAT superfamily N-acetyltransferase